MRTQLDKKLVKRISSCFSAIGFAKAGLPKEVSYFCSPYWRNSTMSPILLLDRKFAISTLDGIERHFKNNLLKSPFSTNDPYLQFFDDSYYHLPKMRADLFKNGWLEGEQKDVLNVWLKPLPLIIPIGLHFKVGRYFDPQLNAHFIKVMRKNFGRSDELEKGLSQLHKEINERLLVVVIYNSKNKPIASGLVATKGISNYLYCGSVVKEVRNRGIWKLLVAIRQAVSNAGSDSLWVTTARNPGIKGKGDLSFKILTFNKPQTK